MKQDFHPKFISRYETLFEKEEFNTFLEYCTKPLKKSIRVNTGKISILDFEKLAEKNNWNLEKISYLENWYNIKLLDNSKLLWKSIESFSWLFYSQETSSMIPPIVLNPKQWDIILDMSAAP